VREKILIAGGTNVGKSMALIHLAMLFPDRKVFIFDPEGEINNLLEEIGIAPPNLTVKQVTPDWGRLVSDYLEAKKVLGEDDWCCFDMLGVFWDLAQNYFSKSVYGASPAEHIIALRKEAKRTDFGGFDGLTDWTVIKRLHNEDIFDDAVRWSPFNVMCATSLANFSPKTKVPTTGVEGLLAKEFGQKLEGEKHHKYRFRTIAILYQPTGTNRFCFKLVKIKGKVLVHPLQEFEFTGTSFWQVYNQYRGI